MGTSIVHCRWEDDMVRERTDHPHPLADPEQKRGGQILAEIFERPFLGVSRKNVSIPHLFSKISDDLF